MSNVENFIEDYRSEGTVEGDGGFTVNFDKARIKLAQYQLKDPYEFIVRFAQAANLAGDWFNLEFSPETKITIQGWNPEYTTDKIVDSFLSPNFDGCDDAIDYLRVALSTLYHRNEGDVEVVLKVAGQTGTHRVVLGETITKSFQETELENLFSTLEVVWSQPKELIRRTSLRSKILNRLKRTHLLSKIPICYEGKPLPFLPPRVTGDHVVGTPQYDDVLAWHYVAMKDQAMPSAIMVLEEKFPLATSLAEDGGRSGFFELTADSNDQMTIYLAKAGMIIDYRKRPLEYGQAVAYVDADDLDTDITGSRFRKSHDLGALLDWAQESSALLIEPAIKESKKFETKPIKFVGIWIMMPILILSLLGIAYFFWEVVFVTWFINGTFWLDPMVVMASLTGAFTLGVIAKIYLDKNSEDRGLVKEKRQRRTAALIKAQKSSKASRTADLASG